MGGFDYHKSGKNILVLDISSSSVGGMMIRKSKDGKAQIVAYHRTHSNFLLDINFDVFWRVTRAAALETISRIRKDFPERPDAVFCVFSSPWYISQTRVMRVRREKPSEITRGILKKLLDEEQKIFLERWKKGQSSLAGELAYLERQYIKTELNGYETKTPIGKTARTMRLEVYFSLGSKRVMDEIKSDLFKMFGDISLAFGSFPYVSYSILSSVINVQDGLLLVDVSGEITDISMMRRNSIEETVSFPEGKNLLLRKIGKNMNASPKEAYSLLNAYASGHLDNAEKEKILATIEEARGVWCEYFKKAMESMKENLPFPQNLFLVGSDGIGLKFIECVKGDYFSQFTLLGKPFLIQNISGQSLSHYFDMSGYKGKNHDAFLMIESLYSANYNFH
ncbi:MAG TPA: hypothetical protein VJJ73_01300 [Candidatus Paceibacterota bacterium]